MSTNNEPIFILKRVRLFDTPINILGKTYTALFLIVALFVDKPYFFLISTICLICIVYVWLIPDMFFRSIYCYDDFMIVNFFHLNRKIYYKDINWFYITKLSRGQGSALDISCKMKFNRFIQHILTPVSIPIIYLDKAELEKFKQLLLDKNVKYEQYNL